jgi:hypothetical protein
MLLRQLSGAVGVQRAIAKRVPSLVFDVGALAPIGRRARTRGAKNLITVADIAIGNDAISNPTILDRVALIPNTQLIRTSGVARGIIGVRDAPGNAWAGAYVSMLAVIPDKPGRAGLCEGRRGQKASGDDSGHE